MKKLLTLFLFFCITATHYIILAQTPLLKAVGGETQHLGNRRYRLTEEKSYSVGALWSRDKVDLRKPFDILTKVYLGDKNNSGADGIALIFHTQPNYMPFGDASTFNASGLDPSLAIEIDTYNSSGNNDPNNDHVAIQKNGNFVHGSNNSLAAPVNASPNTIFLNIEDGDDHFFRFTWNPTTRNLKIFFDCSERINLTYNVIDDIFGGNSEVYWGFIAACGLNNNRQEVEVLRCSALDDYQEKAICDGTPVQIEASYGNSFNWSPALNLTSTNTRSSVASPIATTTYIANVQHECSLTYNDTVKVVRPNLTPNNWTKNITICQDKTLNLDATAPESKFYTWSDNTTDAIKKITTSGNYKVTISDGNCTNIVAADVTINPTPKFNLGADFNFCDNTNIVLDATAIDGVTYAWNTGSATPKISVNKSGEYITTVTSSRGCTATDSIKIMVRPTYKINETVNICQGTSYVYLNKSYTKDTIVKNNFFAANGCDSNYTLTIKVLPKRASVMQKSICKGNTFDFYGNTIGIAGNYQHTLKAANGCDSVITLQLKVIESDTNNIKALICRGKSYVINNQAFTESGLYPIKFTNSLGCDSFVLLSLTVDKGIGLTFQDSICIGSSYDFLGQKLDKAGTYTKILQNLNGCDSLITLNLSIKKAPTVALNATKTLLCPSETAIISATSGFSSYTWNSPQGNNQTLSATEAGIYSVSVTNQQGCVGFDEIEIKKSSPMAITLAKRTPSCAGYADGLIEIKSINGGIAPYTYSIDGKNYSKALIYNNLREGNFTIYVRDTANCEAKLDDNLQNPIPKRISISDQSHAIALGDSAAVSILPTFSDIQQIRWTPSESVNRDDLDAWLKPVRSTKYSVIVTDSLGCQFSDTVLVNVDTRLKLFLPNIFSANIDGTNDELRPFSGIGVERILSFRVFDRWGVLMFEALDYAPNADISWDGYFKGQRVNEGVYLVHLKVRKLNGEIENVSNEVMLMR
jgi:hypothetical protein